MYINISLVTKPHLEEAGLTPLLVWKIGLKNMNTLHMYKKNELFIQKTHFVLNSYLAVYHGNC